MEKYTRTGHTETRLLIIVLVLLILLSLLAYMQREVLRQKLQSLYSNGRLENVKNKDKRLDKISEQLKLNANTSTAKDIEIVSKKINYTHKASDSELLQISNLINNN